MKIDFSPELPHPKGSQEKNLAVPFRVQGKTDRFF